MSKRLPRHKASPRGAGDVGIRKAALSAGLSRAELEAKLDRLGMLVEEDNLQLVAAMIAGVGDAWLYEALLAGAAIDPDGRLKPGKVLKRFGPRAAFILVQAIAAMPDGLSLHRSVRKDAAMTIAIDADTADIVAEVSLQLPRLHAQWDYGDLNDLDELLPQTGAFLAKHGEDLRLAVRTLNLEAAASLAKHKGDLELGLTELPDSVAAVLAKHRGALGFTGLRSISAPAAAALAKHVGRLELGESDRTFTLDAKSARHLGRHAGRVDLPGLKRLDSEAAMALANQRHGIGVNDIEAFAGPGGVRLCERLAASSDSFLSLTALKTLSSDCASALAGFKGQLCVRVKAWNDDSMIALAKHRGELEIDPPRLSSSVAAALAGRSSSTALTFSEFKALSLGDEAASILSTYEGELAFAGNVEMSSTAAESLTQRKSLILFRSKIKPSIRRIFESAGRWKDSVWTRRVRPAGKASSRHAGDIRHSKIPKRS